GCFERIVQISQQGSQGQAHGESPFETVVGPLLYMWGRRTDFVHEICEKKLLRDSLSRSCRCEGRIVEVFRQVEDLDLDGTLGGALEELVHLDGFLGRVGRAAQILLIPANNEVLEVLAIAAEAEDDARECQRMVVEQARPESLTRRVRGAIQEATVDRGHPGSVRSPGRLEELRAADDAGDDILRAAVVLPDAA